MGAARKLNSAMFSSDSAEWGTPRPFYRWLDAAFGFTIDVCASAENHKHRRYFDRRVNGLAQSWAGHTFFMNPPYGTPIGSWMAKARAECIFNRAAGVCVLPSRVDTEWWKQHAMSSRRDVGRLLRSFYDPSSGVVWLRWEGLITGIYHHDQRLEFEGMDNEDGAPFPTSVVIHMSPQRRLPPPLVARR
jgi:phage N-6-adenine-methyltransferase